MSTNSKRQPVRITKVYVDNLKPPQKNQSFLRDAELKGFGVRITSTGVKSFILEKRINGRVRRQTLGRYPDLSVEEARKQAHILLGDIAKGKDPVAEKAEKRARGITLEEAFEDYKRARKNLKPGTLYDYERYVNKTFKDWRKRPLLEISKQMVARRHTKIGEESGPANANHSMRFLRALFNFAMEQYENAKGESLIKDNPVHRLTRTRAWYRVERRRTIIKPRQLPAWYQAVEQVKADLDDDTVGDYLLLLLFTGLRRSEGITLTWDNVDLVGRTLTIPDPKNREPLDLPLSDYVQDLLEARHAKRNEEDDYVFPGTGKTGHLIEPKKQVAKIRELSGVEFRLHDLRRTFITMADSLDLSYYAIKHLLNHKIGGDVTAGYIVHDVERLRKPMQQITDSLKRAIGILGADSVIKFPLKAENKA